MKIMKNIDIYVKPIKKMQLDVGSEPTLRFVYMTCINLPFGKGTYGHIEFIVYIVVTCRLIHETVKICGKVSKS